MPSEDDAKHKAIQVPNTHVQHVVRDITEMQLDAKIVILCPQRVSSKQMKVWCTETGPMFSYRQCVFSETLSLSSCILVCIKQHHNSLQVLINVVHTERMLLDVYTINLPMNSNLYEYLRREDHVSTGILQLPLSLLLTTHTLFSVVGDGNCLYHASSLALCGTEMKH